MGGLTSEYRMNEGLAQHRYLIPAGRGGRFPVRCGSSPQAGAGSADHRAVPVSGTPAVRAE